MSLDRKLKVCFIGWGDHVHLERWAGYFPKLGYEISVISFSGYGNYPGEVTQYSLETVPFGSYKLRTLYLRYLFWKIKPDIVHVHYAGFLLAIKDFWKGVLVLTAWGSDIYHIEKLPDNEKTELKKMLLKPDVVTCDSEDLAKMIVDLVNISPEKLKVIQWGVDTNNFRPIEGISPLAQELDIVGRPVVISPRNFLPLYRIIDIVKAMKDVVKSVPDVVLLLKRYNKDEDYNNEVMRLIEELKLTENTIILDRVEYNKMADFYCAGDVMVSIPETDGTPMSLLESMACGCPPVVSDVASVKEWVTDGENGFIIKDHDITALSESIIRLLTDSEEANRMVKRNINQVNLKASQDANMKMMDRLYKNLVS